MPLKPIKPGESKTYDCGGCSRCFNLLLEPSMEGANEKTLKSGGFPDAAPKCCPFCGEEDLSTMDDE